MTHSLRDREAIIAAARAAAAILRETVPACAPGGTLGNLTAPITYGQTIDDGAIAYLRRTMVGAADGYARHAVAIAAAALALADHAPKEALLHARFLPSRLVCAQAEARCELSAVDLSSDRGRGALDAMRAEIIRRQPAAAEAFA